MWYNRKGKVVLDDGNLKSRWAQETEVRKYSFVNRSISDWDRLPTELYKENLSVDTIKFVKWLV